MTGKHLVRDVFCKNCNIKIGWMYEYAVDPDQVYKEGCVILERKLLREVEEPNNSLAERWHTLTRTQSTSSVTSSPYSR
uniref:Protein yippee-like n=1 Tax=Acrobeloides nanus TaxID=290746 RepID=A0A914EN40_9BILA